MKAGIVVFPGTNCDRDTKRACEFFGWQAEFIWHDENHLDEYDVIFLPGGFSYGDYLRAGRLAKFSPAVSALRDYIRSKRGFVVGICNGFQILCESGYLPGALTENLSTRFICKNVDITSDIQGFPDNFSLPVAHKEGRLILSEQKSITEHNFKYFRYINNPNGSIDDIAGMYDVDNRIIGLMPHPERAVFKATGNTDGRYFFEMIEAGL